MEWYYAEAGERVGPIPEAEFRALWSAGKIAAEHLVWSAGMAGWQPLGTLDWRPRETSVPDTGACTECKRAFARDELLAFESARVCGSCKAIFFQRLREQGISGVIKTFYPFAGFWIRVLARFIDGAILWAFFIALMFVWEAAMRRVIFDPAHANAYDIAAVWGGLGLIYLISTAALIVYESWFLSHRGATPGKLAVGVRVIRANGQPLSTKRSIGRSFAYLLSSMLPLAIGFIMAGADEEKRALHDRICDTRVVHKS
ncbi:MAG TPA: RDD family protein [Bryobacteraceae bacterium]|jgi:uncharacterized RDD family membrane protein YckC|nr:RDD family protein [Bryobacteraceae bacterium]